MTDIKGKINDDIDDFICMLCPQQYNLTCKAFLCDSSDEEYNHRIEYPIALCEEINNKSIKIPSIFYSFDKMALEDRLTGKSIEFMTENSKSYLPKYMVIGILFWDKILSPPLSSSLIYSYGIPGFKELKKTARDILKDLYPYVIHKLLLINNENRIAKVNLPNVVKAL